MPLEYSPRAMIGYSELYARFNEKSIFVEDEAGRIVHERIVSKIIGGGRISRVFPLNGREFVLEEWRKNKENKNNIYIIDGDLDLLYGVSRQDSNLHTLESYCVENFLFRSDNVSSVIEDYVKDHNGLPDRISVLFNEILRHKEHVLGLFVLYAICHRRKCNSKNVKEGGLRFFKDGRLSSELINNRKRHFIKLIIAEIGRPAYWSDKQQIKDIIKKRSELTDFLSAKSFLFPVLHKILEKEFSFVGSVSLLVKQCSRYFSPEHAKSYTVFLRSHFPEDKIK
jgi:hypothetical protein